MISSSKNVKKLMYARPSRGKPSLRVSCSTHLSCSCKLSIIKFSCIGLSTWPVNDIDGVAKLLSDASHNRATGRTAMNAHSSRSHAICTFTLKIVRPMNLEDSRFENTLIHVDVHFV